MSKRTRGRWFTDGVVVMSDPSHGIQQHSLIHIAEVDNGDDARLIAAAPDLADVLCAYIQLCDDDGQTVYALDKLREDMHAALQKAGYDVPDYVSEV